MDDLTNFFGGAASEIPDALKTLNPSGLKSASTSGLADLTWLDVDEKAAREVDTLPKQNLDFAPELAAQWSHEDKHPLAYFVPNRDTTGLLKDPKIEHPINTMGDLSQAHGPLRLEPESQMLRLARLTLIQSTDLAKWGSVMFSKYSKEELSSGKTALAGVLAERGLLGGYYLDSADFPKCATSKVDAEFVRRHAAQALFVQSKTACGDCAHNQAGRCGVFHKQLVPEIPYTEELAQQVAQDQGARGFTASTTGPAKTRIQSALLNRESSQQPAFTGQNNRGGIIPAERLLRKGSDIKAQEDQVREAKARPIVALIRRELLKGRDGTELVKSLRLAFDQRDLQATQQYWGPLFKEAGLYGSVYSTQDSFDDCRTGADFLSKHASKVRAIVAGDKCSSCIFNKVSRCMMYGRKLVASLDEVYTQETVAAVLDEHKTAGSISPYLAKQDWGATPREALQNIHKTASSSYPVDRLEPVRMGAQSGYFGVSVKHASKELTQREIITTARQYLNEGLYGQALGRALTARFDSRDLVAAAVQLKSVFAEQGLQGIFYVDPTVYEDYGHGCKTAERKHRSRQAVEYAKVGDKCGSCVHQTMPGYCSVLNKKLAREVPYLDKTAQQRAVLASGEANQIDLSTLMGGGPNIVQEFQLTGGTGHIQLNPEAQSVEASIEFGNNAVDIAKL